MPRKPGPSFDLKLIIWDIAATNGTDNYSVIYRELDRKLEELRKEGSFFETTPDPRKVKNIIELDIQGLKPEVVMAKLPLHIWHLRNDYEAIKQLAESAKAGQEVRAKAVSKQNQCEEIPSTSDPWLQKHREDVLGLLDKVLLELKLPNVPEDFVSLPKSQEDFPAPEVIGAIFNGFNGLPTQDRPENTDSSEILRIGDLCVAMGAPKIEWKLQIKIEPGFAVLRGHYKHTGLWRDIRTYEKLGKEYLTLGRNLQVTVMTLQTRLRLTRDRAEEYFRSLRSLMKVLEPDKSQLSEDFRKALPGNNETPQRGELQEVSALLSSLFEQMYALHVKWKALKRLEGRIAKKIGEERLKRTLPAGTTCAYCHIGQNLEFPQVASQGSKKGTGNLLSRYIHKG